MAAPNRAAILAATHKVLKKHYTPVKPAERPVLPQLLYGLCLENSPYDKTDEAFGRLERHFFDLNEVRVSTVREIADELKGLSQPEAAAWNIKRLLQNVFESQFSFDLEPLRKENLGKAIKQLEKYEGVTPFAVAYVTQTALGGHAIPVDQALLQLMLVLGVITEAEAEKGAVPGMERAIPKAKGIEFASLVHQLAVDFAAAPFSSRVRSMILEIDPQAKARLPKRARKSEGAAEGAEEEEPAPAEPAPAAKKTAAKAAMEPRKSKAKKAPAAKKSTSRRLTKKKPR